MTWKQARMDNVEGFSKAHIEKLPDGKRAVVGTFKGLREFHNARKGTSAWMMYRGLVKEGGKLHRVEVFASVQIQARSAKFRSSGAFTLLEEEVSQMRPPTQPTRFTAAQRDALDAIGDALKHRRIDFFMAAELSDQVKAGEINAVLKALNVVTRQGNEPN